MPKKPKVPVDFDDTSLERGDLIFILLGAPRELTREEKYALSEMKGGGIVTAQSHDIDVLVALELLGIAVRKMEPRPENKVKTHREIWEISLGAELRGWEIVEKLARDALDAKRRERS